MDKTRQNSPEMNSRIEQLPDDVLLHIMSFLLTLADIARTSVLSSRWKDLWRYNTCLDFDCTSMLDWKSMLDWERLVFSQYREWYIEWVNKVIDARIANPGLPSVKEFRIRYELHASHGVHIDRWIRFAIANQVETLYLELNAVVGIVERSQQFKLSEETWLRAPSGLSSLKCLKSLFLSCVNVSKQFIEFILSSCPLLEDLPLNCAGSYTNLDVSGALPPWLRRLKIDVSQRFAIAKLCAPYLTSFYHKSNKFCPQKIDVPLLTDLTIGGGTDSQDIMHYLEHFWSYLPQLERLVLIMDKPQEFRLEEMPKLSKLKYLMIRVNWNTDSIFHRILNFINACPLLETFAYQIFMEREMWMYPQTSTQARLWDIAEKSCCFKSLKALELYGGKGRSIDLEAIKFIINNSPSLEKLMVDIRQQIRYPNILPLRPEIAQSVEVKAKKLCQERKTSHEIEITVIG